MSDTSLVDEFVLLAYDEAGGSLLDRTRLDLGLGGALLLELALAGRVDVVDRKLVVVDPTPTGDALVDDALRQLTAGKRRKAVHWVRRFAKGARGRVLDRLVTQGTLRRTHGTVLLVFPRTRYPAAEGAGAAAKALIRQRLHDAVAGTAAVPPRTAGLCALVAATRLDRKLFGDLPRGQVKARLKEIGQGAWAAKAVRKAIEEVQAAVTSAVVAAAASSS